MSRQTIYIISTVLLIISAFVSCEYEPEGFFEQEVEDPSIPNNTKEGFSFNNTLYNDTIYLHFYNLRFFYSNPNPDRELTGARYSINGGSMEDLNVTYSPNFEVELYQLNDGINTIQIELDFNSGTNSMADIIGAEIISSIFEFKVFKIPMYSNAANSLKSSIDGGALKIEWSKYEYNDFDYYGLFSCATIKKQDQTYYIDESFYETYDKTYELDVVAGNREVSSNSIRVSYQLPKLKYEKKDGGYLFSWDKTKFYKADFRYVVGGMFDDIIWFESEDKNDTSFFVQDLPFGRNIEFNLNFLRNNVDYDSEKEGSKITDIAVGDVIPSAICNKGKLFNRNNNQVIFYGGYNFLQYDESLNSVVRENVVQDNAQSYFYGSAWNSSENSNYIVGANNEYVLRFDLNTFQTTRILSLSEFKSRTGLNYRYYFNRVIADEIGNYYICVSDNSSDYSLYRFNADSNEIVKLELEVGLSPKTKKSVVSADGKYIFLKGGLCKIEDTHCALLYEMDEAIFVPGKDEVICFNYSVYNGRRVVNYLDLQNLSFDKQRNYVVDRFQSYSLDYEHAIVYVNSYDHKPSLINLETGTVLKTLNVTDVFNIFLLADSYLYALNGRRIPF